MAVAKIEVAMNAQMSHPEGCMMSIKMFYPTYGFSFDYGPSNFSPFL